MIVVDISLKEIFQHIYPSIVLGQYKIHSDEEGVYGFETRLLDEAEQNYDKN